MAQKQTAKATTDERPHIYMLEGIPADLWRQVKARAAADGFTVRYVMLLLMQMYVESRTVDTAATVARKAAFARRVGEALRPGVGGGRS
jgi:hypothetical protein